MSMFTSAFCIKCREMYNVETHKMCVGKCSHSICEPCFDRKLSEACSICEMTDAFETKTINWQAHGPISAYNDLMSSSPTVIDTSFCSQDFGSGPCSECKQHSEKLRVCADCTIMSGLLTRSTDGRLEISCPDTQNDSLNAKILRIRSIAVCSDCALDGPKHKGHELILTSQIEHFKEVFTMQEFYSSVSFFQKKLANRSTSLSDETDTWEIINVVFQNVTRLAEKTLKVLETPNMPDEHRASTIFLSKSAFLCFKQLLVISADVMKKGMEKSIKLMEEAEGLEEKEKWRKSSEELASLYLFLRQIPTGNRPSFVDVFQPDAIQKVLNVPLPDNEESRRLVNAENDLRKTFKEPPQFDEYDNIAKSVLQSLEEDLAENLTKEPNTN
ncbi:hypothetical protein B9Z55_012995 [Caenorhabditis nigoni]|uniref:RING-type domain-containing protein n=2 Tax=Caenorhabditis nigoni TaxID=1611254 RepID=A0A2G5TZX8_9PELO|nr:hypothetical protein B9Z55_012995 [Caenorhabditis nigoni]